MPDRLEEQALLGLAGDDGRPAVAALEQAVAVIDAQAALGVGVGGVAGVAVADQERPDLLLEERHRRFARGGLARAAAAAPARRASARGITSRGQKVMEGPSLLVGLLEGQSPGGFDRLGVRRGSTLSTG